MKRAREEPVVARTYFEVVPHEVFHHIANFLRLVDVCALYRATVREDVEERVPLLGGMPLRTQLDNLADPVRRQCAAEISRQIAQAYRHVTESAYGYRRWRPTAEDCETTLVATRRLLNDPCTYARCLYVCNTCDRCGDAFATVTLWKETAHPVYFCLTCDRTLRATTGQQHEASELRNNEWAWITAARMKQLCGVPASVRADAFATERGIRSISSTDHSRGPSKKNYYLYKDMAAFISSK